MVDSSFNALVEVLDGEVRPVVGIAGVVGIDLIIEVLLIATRCGPPT